MAQVRRTRNNKKVPGDESRFTVRGIRRDPLDIAKLSKALIGLAMAEQERAAQVEHASRTARQFEVTVEPDQQAGGVNDA
jgi:hypothetical protein